MIKLWPPMCQSFRKDCNDKVVATNVSILQKVQMDNLPNIIFWRHHGFWEDDSFLCRDGVHLINRHGMRTYFRRIRRSVLHAQSVLGNISFAKKKKINKCCSIHLHINNTMYFNTYVKLLQHWLVSLFKCFN